MASPRGVSVLDRAKSPLRTPFLTGFRHFACHFSLIYGSVTWSSSSLANKTRNAGLSPAFFILCLPRKRMQLASTGHELKNFPK